MAKHTDPKPYIETDDTAGHSIRGGYVSPEGASDDTEGNNGSCRFGTSVSAEGETDDTEGNGAGCRF